MDITFLSGLFSLKNSRPCRDLNLGTPQYQANKLPIEPSWPLTNGLNEMNYDQ